MPDRRVFDEPNHAHFITFSCYKRRKLLATDDAKRIVVETLGARLSKNEAMCLGFVVMPDYVHVLLWFGQTGQLSRLMNQWKSGSSHKIKHLFRERFPVYWAKIENDSEVWQPRYYDFSVLTSEKSSIICTAIPCVPGSRSDLMIGRGVRRDGIWKTSRSVFRWMCRDCDGIARCGSLELGLSTSCRSRDPAGERPGCAATRSSGTKVMKVVVEPYHPRWVDLFDAESEVVARALAPNARAIHHIGSTAIPGIHAKPIIDMLVEVNEIDGVDRQTPSMTASGYLAMGEFGIPGRRYFRKHDDQGVRTHHVHVFTVESRQVARHLVFRDFLIAHPGHAQQYSTLKQKLATAYPDDIDSYMDGKDALIQEIERLALEWSTAGGA